MLNKIQIYIKFSSNLLGLIAFSRSLKRWYGNFCALFGDYLATRKSLLDLFRHGVNEKNKSKTVLILLLDDDSLYSVKLLSFVAIGLRLRGWNSVVLLKNRGMVIARLYCRLFGHKRFMYLSDYQLTSSDRKEVFKQVEILIKDYSIGCSLKNLSYKGCSIGLQTIATLSRINYKGHIDFCNDESKKQLEKILPNILAHVTCVGDFFKNNSFDLILTIEANYSVFGPLIDLAVMRGTEVIQVIQPWREDGLFCKRLTKKTRRQHPASVEKSSLAGFLKTANLNELAPQVHNLIFERYSDKWALQKRNQPGTKDYSKQELADRFQWERKNNPTAVIFSQVLWDGNLFYGDDLFADAGEWFIETVKAAVANPSVNWVVKLHPANIWKRKNESVSRTMDELEMINRQIGAIPNHVKLLLPDSDISTLSLFQYTDFGVTIRGTIGVELSALGKWVVTSGTGRYSNMGFTLDSNTREEFLSRLSTLQDIEPMSNSVKVKAIAHSYLALQGRVWEFNSARSVVNPNLLGGPLYQNLLMNDFKGNSTFFADLEELARWMESSKVDFLQ